MAEPLHDKIRCTACGGKLSVAARSALHDLTYIDVTVECDSCTQYVSYVIDMDEMEVIPGVKK